MKQKLQRKLKKSGGFTLIEMLIVVAIIAILVAVSIPMVNTSLTKAKIATDDANERAAKAAAIAEYLLAEPTPTSEKTYCYDAASGKALEKSGATCPTVGGSGGSGGTAIANYGKSTAKHADGTEANEGNPRDGHVEVTVNTDGTTEVTWKKN